MQVAGSAFGKKHVYKDKSCHFKGKFKFKCSNAEKLKEIDFENAKFQLRCNPLKPSGYFTRLYYEVSSFLLARQPLQWARASSFTRFLDHTQRRTTVGRTPLNGWSPCRRDLYLTTHNTHNRHLCPSGIRNHNLRRRATADLRHRPRGHWDLHYQV